MSVRVEATPSVLTWALEVSSADPDKIRSKFAVERWIEGTARPTLKQLQSFAASAGVPFGYLLLPDPPEWDLPVPDFREGFATPPTPSADLVAVLNLSQRRQAWYREHVLAQGATPRHAGGVLQALNRERIRPFDDFDATYDAEVRRLVLLQEGSASRGGGDHYNNQPFRVGEKLSRALIDDTLEGRTSLSEAMSLMSMKSLTTFDEYARRLGAA